MPNADEDLSTEELDEWDEIEDSEDREDDDPLFGKIDHHDGLKLLLSPKGRNSSSKNALKRKSGIIDAKKSKRVSTGLDILQQLQVHMKDPLDKELGFSLKKDQNNLSKSGSGSRDFIHLMDEVKRERKIRDFLTKKEKEEYEEKMINEKVHKWIRSNVFDKFLDIDNGGIKTHAKWVSQLSKHLKTIINQNDGKFDVDIINSKILEDPQYGVFKCFTNQGLESVVKEDFSLFFADEYSLQNILESQDIKYIENFSSVTDRVIVEKPYNSLRNVLDALGFNSELVLKDGRHIRKTFDNKNDLPCLGCGFQVYKFIKILDNKQCSSFFSERDILKTLILMNVDCNVDRDTQRYFYSNGYYTGKELAVIKIKEFKHDVLIVNDILRTFFSQSCPELWFKLINTVGVKNTIADKLFVGKLILRFLKESDVNDGVEIYGKVEIVEELEELFIVFCTFLKDMSGEHLRLEKEDLLELVYMKVELIKEMIIINHEVIKKWKHSVNDGDRLKELRSSILKIKNHYFKEYDKNFNPVIPKCRKVLDFLYHELAVIEVGDFFVDDDSCQSKQF